MGFSHNLLCGRAHQGSAGVLKISEPSFSLIFSAQLSARHTCCKPRAYFQTCLGFSRENVFLNQGPWGDKLLCWCQISGQEFLAPSTVEAALSVNHLAGCLINNRHLFLTFWRLDAHIQVPAWPCSSEGPLPGWQTATSHHIHTWQRTEGPICGLFCKGNNHMMRAPPSQFITSQRPHLQIPPHWGFGFLNVRIRRHKGPAYGKGPLASGPLAT